MKEEIKKEDIYISQPSGASLKFHIFYKKDDRSLCGRYAILFKNEDTASPVTGSEVFKRRQDCKSCFKKAGLKVE